MKITELIAELKKEFYDEESNTWDDREVLINDSGIFSEVDTVYREYGIASLEMGSEVEVDEDIEE